MDYKKEIDEVAIVFEEKNTVPKKSSEFNDGKIRQKELKEKQLLAPSRYFLFKPSNKWIVIQEKRTDLLLCEYPKIAEAYTFSMYFSNCYENKNKYRLKSG